MEKSFLHLHPLLFYRNAKRKETKRFPKLSAHIYHVSLCNAVGFVECKCVECKGVFQMTYGNNTVASATATQLKENVEK